MQAVYSPVFGLSQLWVRILATLLGGLAWIAITRNHGSRRLLDGPGAARMLIELGLVLRVGIALSAPNFEGFDERAHMQFVRSVYTNHALPVQLGQPLEGVDYEAYQPPLFYLTSVLPYSLAHALVGEQETVLLSVVRLYNVGLWLLFVLVALRVLAHLPLAEDSRLTSLALMCLLPTHAYVSSMVSNDNLLPLLSALAFLVALEATDRIGYSIALGLCCGALLLTKLNGLCVMLGASLLLGARLWQGGHSLWRVAVRMGTVFAIAGLVWLPWLLRNRALYGSWLALERGNFPTELTFGPALLLTIRSLTGGFWATSGRFSSLSLWPGLAFAITLALAWGLLLDLRNPSGRLRHRLHSHWPAALGLGVCLASNALVAIRFGLLTGMPHGRFLFPSLIPLSLLYAVAVRALSKNRMNVPVLGVGALFAYSVAFTSFTLGMMGVALPIGMLLGLVTLLIASRLAPARLGWVS